MSCEPSSRSSGRTRCLRGIGYPTRTIVFLAVIGLWFEGETADHRDAAQWDFYVVPALSLPEGQRTISLSKIKKLARPVPITGLGEEIDRVRVSPSS